MKLKNLTKACNKDKSRPTLQNVNVRRDGETIIAEATDGHILVQLRFDVATAPKPLADLAQGQYTTSDWCDLVCKERMAEPVKDPPTFPDCEQAVPALTQYENTKGCAAIGCDLRLLAVVQSIADDAKGLKLMFIDDLSPIRIDHEASDYVGCKMTAVIMPFRIR